MQIRFNNVTYYYEKKKRKKIVEPAIKNINISFDQPGEFIMIIGKTGAGKSTLLSHINGLLLPSEGSVEVSDYKLTPNKFKNPKLKKIRSKIGYVFQFPEYQLFAETVLQDIIYGPKNFGIKETEAQKRAIDVAKQLNILDILDKSPFEISGGQMRKAAIAGIVAYNPDVYLLDEPTRGLDPKGAVEIMDFFQDLAKNQEKTMIMITHDMDILYQYATRVIVIDEAEIKYDGDKESFFKDEYLKYGFNKPNILKIIDEINKNTKHKISYYNYNIDDLLKSLKDGDKHE